MIEQAKKELRSRKDIKSQVLREESVEKALALLEQSEQGGEHDISEFYPPVGEFTESMRRKTEKMKIGDPVTFENELLEACDRLDALDKENKAQAKQIESLQRDTIDMMEARGVIYARCHRCKRIYAIISGIFPGKCPHCEQALKD